MAQAKARPSVVQQEVARLLIRGTRGKLGVIPLAREDDLDLVVSIPHDGPGVIGLRIETASRLTRGPFGEWLVIDAIAPSAHFQNDPRAVYLFGEFSPTEKAFAGPVFIVPAALLQEKAGVKGRSARISFRARLDAVNQEWSDFAFDPEKVGAHLLDLLSDMPQYSEQAA
jgi:hypothetical protein